MDASRGIGPNFYEYARYGLRWREPVSLITDPFMRDPRDVLEELRETNPDEHALLTELVVLPEKRRA